MNGAMLKLFHCKTDPSVLRIFYFSRIFRCKVFYSPLKEGNQYRAISYYLAVMIGLKCRCFWFAQIWFAQILKGLIYLRI